MPQAHSDPVTCVNQASFRPSPRLRKPAELNGSAITDHSAHARGEPSRAVEILHKKINDDNWEVAVPLARAIE